MRSLSEKPEAAPAVGRRDFIKMGAGASAAAGTAAVAMFAGARNTAAQSSAPLPRATEETIEGWKLRPAGPERPVSVDVHAHWSPDTFIQALTELGANERKVPPLKEYLEGHLNWMNEHGVEMLILTQGGGMPWQWVSGETGAQLSQLMNDAAVEAYAAHPDRFIGTVEVPALDATRSLAELNRMAGKPGIRALHLPPTVAGREFVFEPAFAPVLARCEELGYPIIFHPLDGAVNYYGVPHTHVSDATMDKVRYWNTLGFPFETATLAAKFIVTGTLDKYPKLEIVMPHSGGCFPYLAGRLGHGLERKTFPLQRPYREYLRRFHYDSMTYDLEALRFLVNLVGADRIVIGTDNGFGPNENFDWPNAVVERLNLPAADQDLILRGNAKRLFRI